MVFVIFLLNMLLEIGKFRMANFSERLSTPVGDISEAPLTCYVLQNLISTKNL